MEINRNKMAANKAFVISPFFKMMPSERQMICMPDGDSKCDHYFLYPHSFTPPKRASATILDTDNEEKKPG